MPYQIEKFSVPSQCLSACFLSVSCIRIDAGGKIQKLCLSIFIFFDMLFGIVGKPGSREFRTEITRYFASLKVMCARQHEVELCCFHWVGLKCQC